MRQCNAKGCGSYAVNIERDEPYGTCLCDVCHWTAKHETAMRLLSEAWEYKHGTRWDEEDELIKGGLK